MKKLVLTRSLAVGRRAAAWLLPVLIAGCGNGDTQGTGGSSGSGGAGGSGGTASNTTTTTDGPTLPTGLAEGWNEMKPGGDTICSRGSEFAYWVRPGTVNKVVIDYIGGGSCCNQDT